MFHLSVIEFKLFLCFGFAAGITFFLIPSIVEMATRKSLVAEPNVRTSHGRSIPNLGGIAIFIGFIIAFLLFLNPVLFPRFQYVVAALLIVFFMGFKDDISRISPFKKLFGQIVAAWIAISFGGIRLTSLHGFFGIEELSPQLSYLITMITVVGVTNCFNLMDGIDGLSAGLGILASLAFGTWFYLVNDYSWTMLCIALAGSLCSFMIFNVFGKTNKIFMGDTGSLGLGFVISLAAIHFNEANISLIHPYAIHAAPAVSIGILLIPIFDTLRVSFTRLAHRTSPFFADKTHVHHYLLDLGLSHIQATLVLLGLSLFYIGVSFLLCNLTVFFLLVILFLLAGLKVVVILLLLQRKKRKKVIA